MASTQELRARETSILSRVQAFLVRCHFTSVAHVLSFLGEHAWAWLALTLVGVIASWPNSQNWIVAFATIAVAHAASIMVKRLVRRPRPNDPSVQVLSSAPSQLSFPSSHMTSTTAATIVFIALALPATHAAWCLLLLPICMAMARLTLGMHFLGDVICGAALGTICGLLGLAFFVGGVWSL